MPVERQVLSTPAKSSFRAGFRVCIGLFAIALLGDGDRTVKESVCDWDGIGESDSAAAKAVGIIEQDL